MISSFARRVYRAVGKVPRGRVATYAQVARRAGVPRAARAVGNILHRNPHAPSVPCHRVVRADGRVGGFARGTRAKAAMLRGEGVEVEGGKVDLKRFLEREGCKKAPV